MKLFQNRSTGALIFIMIALVLLAITIASLYYRNENRSVDPRIIHARELYSRYDDYAMSGQFQRIFPLLDSIDSEYMSVRHYSSSFERGVIQNNRAAAQLTIALYSDSIEYEKNPYPGVSPDSLILLAQNNLKSTIETYEEWVSNLRGLDTREIRERIQDVFLDDFVDADPGLKEKYLNTRVKEIEKAIAEADRRLSVSYTNLGITYRYHGEYEKAVEYYKKALDLWDRNLEAENNINKLLGRPIKKRNIIQKLFPPDRDNNVED